VRGTRISTSISPGAVAQAHGISRAQVALAWPHVNLVVAAPLVGASKPSHIDDAVASLDVELTPEEIARLERHYPPRHDFQGISDDAEMQRIMARIPQFTTAPDPRAMSADRFGVSSHILRVN
jgi:1-deoxyxylulose-5-phosphate synthase